MPCYGSPEQKTNANSPTKCKRPIFVHKTNVVVFLFLLLLSIIPRYLGIQRNFNVSPVGFKHLSLGTMKNKKRRQAINDFYTFSNMFGYYGTL